MVTAKQNAVYNICKRIIKMEGRIYSLFKKEGNVHYLKEGMIIYKE